jgi:hypothetical protein
MQMGHDVKQLPTARSAGQQPTHQHRVHARFHPMQVIACPKSHGTVNVAELAPCSVAVAQTTA